MEPQPWKDNAHSVVLLLPAVRRERQKEGFGSYEYCCVATGVHDGWLFLHLYFVALRLSVALELVIKSATSSGLATCDICLLCDRTSPRTGGNHIYGPTPSPRAPELVHHHWTSIQERMMHSQPVASKTPSTCARFGDRVSRPSLAVSGETVVFLDLPRGQPDAALVVESLLRIRGQYPSPNFGGYHNGREF
jgi:hypothetical protein